MGCTNSHNAQPLQAAGRRCHSLGTSPALAGLQLFIQRKGVQYIEGFSTWQLQPIHQLTTGKRRS